MTDKLRHVWRKSQVQRASAQQKRRGGCSRGGGSPQGHTRQRVRIDDDSSSSSEDDRRRCKGSVKTITLDPAPAPHEFRAWVESVYTKVCSASKRSKPRTLRRIMEVEAAEAVTPLETCSSACDDLDTELAEAVLNAYHGAIKRTLLLYQEARTRIRLPLAGRAALWMCFNRFRMDRWHALFIDITALRAHGCG